MSKLLQLVSATQQHLQRLHQQSPLMQHRMILGVHHLSQAIQPQHQLQPQMPLQGMDQRQSQGGVDNQLMEALTCFRSQLCCCSFPLLLSPVFTELALHLLKMFL
ncbi:hypothetical protein QJS04_geneDACA025075 [Acorus gramineus]|uniref:Uncharacterized protein n=1 Tax=Acorus gramineus TaxID=55184 RepID=A0AAV9ACG8_ACOGR|nr:hypothetical protein QJS04_geneDACA025075 [Acorus gramineus]